MLSYIVDFYCHEIGLVIEIDGNSHDFNYFSDADRQGKLEKQGVQFLRFSNRGCFTEYVQCIIKY